MTTEGLWTVDQAAEWFTGQGMPVEAWRLREHIHALSWPPAGEGPSGPSGGRGHAMYPIAALMELHQAHVKLARHATRPAGS